MNMFNHYGLDWKHTEYPSSEETIKIYVYGISALFWQKILNGRAWITKDLKLWASAKPV